MHLAQRILRRLIEIPVSITQRLDERRKKEACVTSEGVRLYPESRIWNFPHKREAISIGKQSHIRGQLVVLGPGGNIQVGDTCYAGEDSRIWSSASIKIGNRVLISHGVNIHDNNSHSLSASARSAHFKHIISIGPPVDVSDIDSASITIEDDVWIGFNATVLKGVKIGRGAIIGAASVVTKDVTEFTIVAGNPARVIGASRP